MIVTDKRARILFKYLGCGDVFVDEGTPFIKIEPIKTRGIIENAVDLVGGVTATFDDSELVEVRKAELIMS